jgi:hypothetical protein
MRVLRLLIVVVFVVCSSLGVRADDAALAGAGGSLKLMKGHRTIRMVEEEVRIDLRD